MNVAGFLGAWTAALWGNPSGHASVVQGLLTVANELAKIPKNDVAHTYTIYGFDGTPYITRTLLPRVDGFRPIIHQIHRQDEDLFPHNHPWLSADFLVVSGGYVDERWRPDAGEESGWRLDRYAMPVGSVNHLEASSFHRARDVQSNTVTVGLVGAKVQEWGFLVNGSVVPSREYFRRRGHVVETGGLS